MLPYEQTPQNPRDDWRLPPDTWSVRRIQPLAFSQVRQFVTNWYTAACRQPAAVYSAEAGAGRAESLIAQLDASTRLRALVESPLLLTMLAILHYNREAGELPRDRARLYDECVRLLLDRWEPVRTPDLRLPGLLERMGIADSARTEDLRAVMHTVALQAHDRPPAPGDGRGLLRGVELEGELSRFLRRLRCDHIEQKLRAFELALRDQTGLLHELGDDSYAFPHLTFQEFLAACALADSPELTAKTYQLWSSADGDRWREAILLLVGRLRQQRKIETEGLRWLRALLAEKTPAGATKGAVQRQRDALLAADCYAEWDGRVALTSFEPPEIDQLEARIARALALVLAREPLATHDDRLRAGRYLGQLGDPRPGVMTLKPDWCVVPAGPFLLGSDDTSQQAKYDGKPQRTVELPAFRIARYPVTNAQWQRFVDAGGYRARQWWSDAGWRWREREGWTQPRDWDDLRFNGPNQPVVGISWYEAVAYCRWLTAQSHSEGWLSSAEQICLPSEAEWEKAARGTDGRTYPWGDEWDAAKANTNGGGIGATTPVGCYPHGASPCGALDMSGKVFEWTATPWAEDYRENDGIAIELLEGDTFAIRGGSWDYDQRIARCAFRNGYDSGYRNNFLGVRVCAALVERPSPPPLRGTPSPTAVGEGEDGLPTRQC